MGAESEVLVITSPNELPARSIGEGERRFMVWGPVLSEVESRLA